MSCTGACCIAFPMGAGRAGRRREDGAPRPQAMRDLPILARLWVDPSIMDGLDILAMVVPLTHQEAVERRARFGDELVPDETSDYFRCIHWDEDTRLCGNYENRPNMCRSYPYGRPCEHGCDCQAARPTPSEDPA